MPVAGDTGDNLEIALGHLNVSLPCIFESANRYDYRTTNSFAEPHSKRIGTSHSEAKISQIRSPDNVRRVKEELKGCKLAILCSRRAQLLAAEVELSGIAVIHARHTGNRALIAKYQGVQVASESTPQMGVVGYAPCVGLKTRGQGLFATAFHLSGAQLRTPCVSLPSR